MTSAEDAFFAAEQPEPDAVLSYGPLDDQVIDVFRPTVGSLGLVVLIHGGFWRPMYDRLHLRRTARGFAAAGWTVASVEYRRVPGTPDASVADVVAATRAVRDEYPDGPPVLIGHSAGGHLALVAAARLANGVAGVVPIGAVTDLTAAERLDLGGGAVGAFLGCAAAARPDLDPMRLPLPPCSIALVHGVDDDIVPASLADDYARRDRRIAAEVLKGVDHFGPVDPASRAWPVTLAALRRASPRAASRSSP